MQRIWIALGSLAGLGAVMMSAVMAHGLGSLDPEALRITASGVQMQGWHALALLAAALWSRRGGRLAHVAALAFAVGTVLFCGAVYARGLTGISLGPAAPAGGIILMLGWLLLGLSAMRAPEFSRTGSGEVSRTSGLRSRSSATTR
jgi:uncharacterized membrane protein YgdD (TMEM256/DUF423 family)